MWVLISNSIKREKENRLGNRWVISQGRNCTVIKPLIWWILFNIWVPHSHYESEQQMFRKTWDWQNHFTDFTLIEMFCDWTHLFMRLLKLWTQLWHGQTNRKMENIPKINVNWLKIESSTLEFGSWYLYTDRYKLLYFINFSIGFHPNKLFREWYQNPICLWQNIYFKYLGF